KRSGGIAHSDILDRALSYVSVQSARSPADFRRRLSRDRGIVCRRRWKKRHARGADQAGVILGVVFRILFVADCAASRPMNMAGPRNVPSSAAFPLIPPKPVTSPAAKRPGIGAPVWFNTRQRRSTPTPPIVFLVIGKNCTA